MNTTLKNTILAISIVGISTSCASTAQLTQLKTDTEALTAKVNAFEVKYEEVLSENKYLKEKLADRVPLAKTTSKEILFEIVSVTKLDKGLEIELVLTNTKTETVELQINPRNILVTDEYGNQYENLKVTETTTSGYIRPVLYPSAPLKVNLTVYEYNAKSEFIGVLGINDIQVKENLSDRFSVYLRNVLLK